MKFYIPRRGSIIPVDTLSSDLSVPEPDLGTPPTMPIEYKEDSLTIEEVQQLTLGMGDLSIRKTSRDNTRPRTIPEKKLPEYSLDDVSYHESYDDCWCIIYDKVYDITDFLSEHPGGDDLLMEYAGRDATIAFASVGHSKGALIALQKYLVGVLRKEDQLYPDGDSWY